MSGTLKLVLLVAALAVVAAFVIPLITNTEVKLDAAPAVAPANKASDTAAKAADQARGSTDFDGTWFRAVTTVESDGKLTYTARSAGIVTAARAKQGTTLAKGDVLLEVQPVGDPREQDFNLRKAEMAKAEADERLRKTKNDNAQREEKAAQAVLDASAKLTDAAAKLTQAGYDSQFKNRRATDALTDARGALSQSVSRFRRALNAYNVNRTLAHLPLVPVPADPATFTGTVVMPRPAEQEFDDSLIKLNDYIESELAMGEAEGMLASARASVGAAEAAKDETKVSTELAEKSATFHHEIAERNLAEAKKAQTDIAVPNEIALNLALSDLAGAVLALEQAKARAEGSKITVDASDDGAVLGELLVGRGDLVSPGQKVATLFLPKNLSARVIVPVAHLPLFQALAAKAGKNPIPVVVETAAFEDSAKLLGLAAAPTFAGSLTASTVSSTVAPSSLGFSMEISLDAVSPSLAPESREKFRLQAGMIVTLKIDLSPVLAVAPAPAAEAPKTPPAKTE